MIHTVCSLFFYQPDAISTFCPAKASIFYTFFQISSFRSGWLPIYFVNITHRFLLIFIDFPSNCHCIHTIFFLFTLHLFSKTAVDSHFFPCRNLRFLECMLYASLLVFIHPAKSKAPHRNVRTFRWGVPHLSAPKTVFGLFPIHRTCPQHHAGKLRMLHRIREMLGFQTEAVPVVINRSALSHNVGFLQKVAGVQLKARLGGAALQTDAAVWAVGQRAGLVLPWSQDIVVVIS